MADTKHLLAVWRRTPEIGQNFEYFQYLPSKQGEYREIPSEVHYALKMALGRVGITKLYSHQAQAFDWVNQGKNIVVSTGTASGKTWCYNLPVLNACLKNRATRSLYIFPTKALTQDQWNNLQTVSHCLESVEPPRIYAGVYDGDTSPQAKKPMRSLSSIILTNPDMLHVGILPHHTTWADFFRELRYIVIDEIHVYRGVFGSHIANLIRRIKRVAAFYGSYPQFIMTSATIGNPVELAEKLVELPVEIIEQDGAPRGEKAFVFYNPPIINNDLGIRRNALAEAEMLASDLVDYQVQSIMFCRTRRAVENAVRRLQQKYPRSTRLVRGYRSGYLPVERREIETDLRNGETRVVAATNALELGIDIGNLDCVILVGYPGSIAATRQQSGRAGRRAEFSLAIFLATNSPLDQFLVDHPEFIFDRSPELALIDPDNLLILLQHLKCAVFELPYSKGEAYGCVDRDLLKGLLELLVNEGILHQSNDRYFWSADQYPASQISLRSASGNTIRLELFEEGKFRIVGVVDAASATWMAHPEAVYVHEGQVFLVKELDMNLGRAVLVPHNDDYYTEPQSQVSVEVVNIQNEGAVIGGKRYYGEVVISTQVVGYQKIRWFTQERVGQHQLEMPITHLRTTAFWLSIDQSTIDVIRASGLWKDDPIDYGPNWDQQRRLARQRDGFVCQNCGIKEGRIALHVHHRIPFRQFKSYEAANVLGNLITLCPTCHRKAETSVRMRSGLAGLGYLLNNLAPLFVMCDIGDLGVLSEPQAEFADGSPGIMVYEQIPGGIGLDRALYNLYEKIMKNSLDQVVNCPCKDGCPACVGPAGENGFGGKAETVALLQVLNGMEINYE